MSNCLFFIIVAIITAIIYIVNLTFYIQNDILFNKIGKEVILLDSTTNVSELRDGDLIYLSGKINIEENLIDKNLNINFNKKPLVARIVEMYQKSIGLKDKKGNSLDITKYSDTSKYSKF